METYNIYCSLDLIFDFEILNGQGKKLFFTDKNSHNY